MDSRTRRLLAFALMLPSGAAAILWSINSFQQKELVGSPFLWAFVLVLFYVGLYIWSTSLPPEEDKARQKQIRKQLILIYLAFTVAIGILFLAFHAATARHPIRVAQSYAPAIILVGIFSYVPFYLSWVRKSDISGRSTLFVPILYLMGAILTPLATIEFYNDTNEEIVTINSIKDIPHASSNFVSIRNLEIDPLHALEYTYHGNNRNKEHVVEFYGLMPVMTGRSDSLFDTWIAVTNKTWYSVSLADSALKRLENKFISNSRERLLDFRPDSVLFYDHSKLDNLLVLRKNNYPVIEGTIVLQPVLMPLNEYLESQNLTFVFMFVIITLFFWFGSAVK